MKPWVVYTRVSTEDQANRGASLEAQLSACQAIAKAHGYAVIHIEDAGVSAKKVDQPGVMRIRALAEERKISGVLVYKLDRIARNTRRLLDLIDHFTEHDVAFTSVHERIDTSGASGRLILTVLAALAQFEREQLVERITATNAHRRAEGAWVGGAPAIGLTTEKRGKLRYLAPDPKWGPIMAQTWRRVLSGQSLRQVCAWLTDVGMPRRNCKRPSAARWSRQTLSYLLQREVYVPHLVDRESFDRTRNLLAGKRRPGRPAKTHTPRATEDVWRLAGLAVCNHCGHHLVGVTARGRTQTYRYLRCTSRVHHGREGCPAPDLPAKAWEDAVVAALAHWAQGHTNVRQQLTEALRRNEAVSAPVREAYRKAIAVRDAKQQRVDHLLEMVAEGGAVARAIGPKLEVEQRELEAAVVAAAELEGRMAGADLTAADIDAAASALAEACEGLAQRPLEEQARVLKILLQRAVIGANAECGIEVRIPRARPSPTGGRFVINTPALVDPTGPRTNLSPIVEVKFQPTVTRADRGRLVVALAPSAASCDPLVAAR